jgi:hypothetical protein
MTLLLGPNWSCYIFYTDPSAIRTPDTSKVRSKMLYASSKDALRRKLVGIAIEVQGTDLDEVSSGFQLRSSIRT